MRRVLPVLVAAAVLLPSLAAAGWSTRATGQATAAALAMTGPTGFTASCTTKTTTVTLSWTPTTDPDVDQYVVARTGAGGGAGRTFTVAGRATAGATDAVTVPTGQTVHTYAYVVRAASTAHGWTSPALAATTSIGVRNNGCL